MLKTSFKIVAVSCLLFVLAACATVPRHIARPYDPNNPLKRVALLPMKNDTNDVDGPNSVRKKMGEALEYKGYIIKDVKETDQTLRDQMGINLGGQLELTTPQKLGEVLGVEGVLYGTLIDFDETTTGVVDVRKVRAKFKLVNTGTAQAFWERGLGVRAETKMSGSTGLIANALARASDSREKDVPWVTIESTTRKENNIGKSFAIGLGTKLLSKATGNHLEREAKEMVKRVTDNLPWGPGPVATTTVATAAAPKFTGPKIKMPEPPSFGYMDYGKKDFSAVLMSVSINKGSSETFKLDIPMAKAGEKIRMEMDLSKMTKGSEGMPPALSRITSIHRGDKKVSYSLYPGSQKYMAHNHTEQNDSAYDKPRVEKTKVGSEVINNHPTDKYKVKITYKDGKVDEGFMWNARDLDDMTIKSELENKDVRVTTELKNISLKTPSASLFEIPAGYTEAQGFMELMMDAK